MLTGKAAYAAYESADARGSVARDGVPCCRRFGVAEESTVVVVG